MRIVNSEKLVEALNIAFGQASDKFDAANSAFQAARDERTRGARLQEMSEANGEMKGINVALDYCGKHAETITPPTKTPKAE